MSINFPTIAAALVVVLAIALAGINSRPAITLNTGCTVYQPNPAKRCYKAPDETWQIIAAENGHDCVPAERWPRTEIPTWTVVRTVEGGIIKGMPFTQAWDEATRGRVWVLRQCA